MHFVSTRNSPLLVTTFHYAFMGCHKKCFATVVVLSMTTHDGISFFLSKNYKNLSFIPFVKKSRKIYL